MLDVHICSKCQQYKPISKFQLYKGHPNGQCRECKTKSEKDRRKRMGTSVRKLSYISENKKLCLNCNQTKYLNDFYPSIKGLGKVASYCKDCHKSKYRNKEKSRKHTANFRKRHRERWLASHRIHQYERKYKVKITSDGSITDEVLIKIYSTKICRYCEKEILSGERTLDHINPLNRGGHHTIDNICMACVSCNSSKRDLTEDEFRDKRSNNRQNNSG